MTPNSKMPNFELTPQMIQNAKPLVCDCGNDTFIQGIKLFKISKIISLLPEDVTIPVPAAICSKCHNTVDLEK